MKNILMFAKKFRNAINAAKICGELSNDVVFKNFPYGCCGDTSDLLAYYLLENNIRTSYISGRYYDSETNNTQTHAWLLFNEQIIIDITADQFKERPGLICFDIPVYVGKDSNFHNLFEVINIRKDVNFETFDCCTRKRLCCLYTKIRNFTEK